MQVMDTQLASGQDLWRRNVKSLALTRKTGKIGYP